MESAESFYQPVGLEFKQHYEDATKDEKLREKVPILRKQILLKDAENKRNREEAEKSRIMRELLEKEAGKNHNKNLDIADMGITYDFEGKVLRIKKGLQPESANNRY